MKKILTISSAQTTFKKEGRRRFEILDAHWDIQVGKENLHK